MSKRIGDVTRIKNTDRKFGANEEYLHIRVQMPDGEETHILLTDSEMAEARDRASKNPEDLIRPGALQDLLD